MFKSNEELRDYLCAHGLSEDAQNQLEYLRGKSPMRDVGKSALTNVVVYLWSNQMKRHLVCESKTCEALCFMQAELSGDVLEILPQVEMRCVERKKGKTRHVGSITADALMLTTTGPVFVECKLRNEVERLHEKRPHDYVRRPDGSIHRPALEEWAKARGCRYEIWSPPEPYGLLWANYEFIHPLLKNAPSEDDLLRARHILHQAEVAPLSLQRVLESEPNADVTLIGRLLAHRLIFANLETGLLSIPDSVLLATDPQRVEDIESHARTRLKADLAPLDVRSRIQTATAVDLKHGRRRKERVEAMLAGKTRLTRDYRKLVHQARKAKLNGLSLLEICITDYCKSGNTTLRLHDHTYTALDTLAREYYEKKGVRDLEELKAGLRLEMDLLKCFDSVPSESTIRRRMRRGSWDRHNLAFGGKRAFHQHRAASDPERRTVNAIAPFTLAHIDSTKFDHRSAMETLSELEFSCPVLYSCIDAGTDEVLGYSLTFGPPSRFGLAALLRDIVRRHGRLPLTIMADRGSELWSNMMKELAELYEINLMMRPASAAKYGSEIELALREINAQVAHKLVGSTLPDQKGRAVDPKHKSYNTARLQFRVVNDAVRRFVFEIWPDRPRGELEGTPRQKKVAAESYFGRTGRDVTFNDDFLIATSVPVLDRISVSADRSIRCYSRSYCNSELRDWVRNNGTPDDVRLDSENPAMGYAKLGSRWIRITASNVLEKLVEDELDRIFDRIYTRDASRIARELKTAANGRTHESARIANEATSEEISAIADPVEKAQSSSSPPKSEADIQGEWLEFEAALDCGEDAAQVS